MKRWTGVAWVCAALLALAIGAGQAAFAADETGTTTGKVVASGDKLTVKPAKGGS